MVVAAVMRKLAAAAAASITCLTAVPRAARMALRLLERLGVRVAAPIQAVAVIWLLLTEHPALPALREVAAAGGSAMPEVVTVQAAREATVLQPITRHCPIPMAMP